MSTTAHALITAELPGTMDPRWSRLPGIEVNGSTVTINPTDYFFRFDSSSWLVTDWQTVRDGLLPVDETAEETIEQVTLGSSAPTPALPMARCGDLRPS